VGVRAVIVVRDDSGQERRFWAPWASKQYQIQYLAQFIHGADQDDTPLTLDGYIAYTASHPDTLPARDITEEGGYADPAETGDLDYRYQLLLCQTQRSFRYVVQDRDRDRHTPGWRVSEDLGTRGQLYEAAAWMCRELATTMQRYWDRSAGVGPPGHPGPDYWRQQERELAGWLEHTDPRPLHRPGPALQPVLPQYTLDAARSLAQQVNTRLRQHHPGVTIRTRVAPDGALTVTVPAELATDAEASRIAQLLGDLLGQPYTVAVRPHRPSRYGVRLGRDGTRTGVNATLTLRPVAAGAATATAGDSASQ